MDDRYGCIEVAADFTPCPVKVKNSGSIRFVNFDFQFDLRANIKRMVIPRRGRIVPENHRQDSRQRTEYSFPRAAQHLAKDSEQTSQHWIECETCTLAQSPDRSRPQLEICSRIEVISRRKGTY